MKAKVFIEQRDEDIEELKSEGWKEFDIEFVSKSLKGKEYDKDFYEQTTLATLYLYKEIEVPGILAIGTFIEGGIGLYREITHVAYNVDFEQMFYTLEND